MNLQERMVEDLAQDMSEAVDTEILVGMYAEMGMGVVDFQHGMHLQKIVDRWCQDTCSGDWHRMRSYYIFDNPADATLFRLQWL